MQALLAYVEIVTKPDQECVTSSEIDHVEKGCELAGLRLPSTTSVELAVLDSEDCVEREAVADSLNVLKSDSGIFTK